MTHALANDGAAALGWAGLLAFPVDRVLVVRGDPDSFVGLSLPIEAVVGYLEGLGLRVADPAEVLRQMRAVPITHVAVVAIDGGHAEVWQAPRQRGLMFSPAIGAA